MNLSELHRLYVACQRRNGSDVRVIPRVMAIDLTDPKYKNALERALDGSVGVKVPDHYDIEEIVEVARTNGGLEAHVLILGRGNGKAVYFEANVGQETAQEALWGLKKGDNISIHVYGKDMQEIAEKLNGYFAPSSVTDRVTDGHPEGEIYSLGGDRYGLTVRVPWIGLHARPAGHFTEAASIHDGTSISIIKDSVTVNAKSIMGVLTLAAEKDTKLLIEADGPDAQKALGSIYSVFTGYKE